MKRNEIPKAIRHIAGLQRAPLFSPGVYFLICRGAVVYVGQSISPTRRIGDHIGEGLKAFDEVFVLDTPQPALNQVEAAFIAVLKPKYNMAEGRQPAATHESERSVDLLQSLVLGARLRSQAPPAPAPIPRPAVQSAMSANRLLRLPEVMATVGVRRSTIYKMMSENEFPQAIKLGARTVVWRASELTRWLESKTAVEA